MFLEVNRKSNGGLNRTADRIGLESLNYSKSLLLNRKSISDYYADNDHCLPIAEETMRWTTVGLSHCSDRPEKASNFHHLIAGLI